jgi:hypothetical protein
MKAYWIYLREDPGGCAFSIAGPCSMSWMGKKDGPRKMSGHNSRKTKAMRVARRRIL